MNQYACVCWSANKENTRKAVKLEKIVRSIAKVKQVSCEIAGLSTCAVPDTGRDSECMSKTGMKSLGVTEEQLIEPTSEIKKKPTTASGQSMDPPGYVNLEIRFGEKSVRKPIVLFNMMDAMILSKHILKELEVVHIKYKPTINAISRANNLRESSTPKPSIPLKPANLKQKATRKKLIGE